MLSLRNMNDKLFEWYPVSRDKLLDEIIKQVVYQIDSSRKTTRGVTKETRLNMAKLSKNNLLNFFMNKKPLYKVV